MKLLSRRDKTHELRRENVALREELSETARENIILRCRLEDYEIADCRKALNVPCPEAQTDKRIAELNAECLRLRCRVSWLEAEKETLEHRLADELQKRLELIQKYLELEEEVEQ